MKKIIIQSLSIFFVMTVINRNNLSTFYNFDWTSNISQSIKWITYRLKMENYWF